MIKSMIEFYKTKKNSHPSDYDLLVKDRIGKMKKKPTHIRQDVTIWFDVDDTLVLHSKKNKYAGDAIEVEHYGFTQTVFPHEGHIKALKVHALKGQYIVVWSANGDEWAKAVLEKLNLMNYVDLILTKPYQYYDDRAAQDWMGKAIYYNS